MKWIGIDLSLTSPGLAVFSPTTNPTTSATLFENNKQDWHLYAFKHRVRKHKDFQHDQITFLPTIPDTDICNEERYHHIITHISNIISSTSPLPTVVLEDYAYGEDSGNSYKLYELSGILKYKCKLELGIDIITIPPTKWKHLCIGNGRASKQDIVDYIIQNGPQLDLMNILQFPKKPNHDPPNPVQDMADACGLILAYLVQIGLRNCPIIVKKKKPILNKKRKVNIVELLQQEEEYATTNQSGNTSTLQYDFTTLFG